MVQGKVVLGDQVDALPRGPVEEEQLPHRPVLVNLPLNQEPGLLSIIPEQYLVTMYNSCSSNRISPFLSLDVVNVYYGVQGAPGISYFLPG